MEKFSEEFQWLNQSNEDLSLVMIDVDHFKEIDDTNDQLAEDQILVGLVQTLKDNTRQTDFVGVDREAKNSEWYCLRWTSTGATRWPKGFGGKSRVRNTSRILLLPVVFGIATHDDTVDDPEDLLNRADEAMYYSK